VVNIYGSSLYGDCFFMGVMFHMEHGSHKEAIASTKYGVKNDNRLF